MSVKNKFILPLSLSIPLLTLSCITGRNSFATTADPAYWRPQTEVDVTQESKHFGHAGWFYAAQGDTVVFYRFLGKGYGIDVFYRSTGYRYIADSTGWAKIYLLPSSSGGYDFDPQRNRITTTAPVFFCNGYTEFPGRASKPGRRRTKEEFECNGCQDAFDFAEQYRYSFHQK